MGKIYMPHGDSRQVVQKQFYLGLILNLFVS